MFKSKAMNRQVERMLEKFKIKDLTPLDVFFYSLYFHRATFDFKAVALPYKIVEYKNLRTGTIYLLSGRRLFRWIVPLLSVILATLIFAQTDHDYAAVHTQGFDPNGNYFAFEIEEDVNTFNGNLVITQQDLHIPGRNGLDVRLARVYNSNVWKNYTHPPLDARSPSYLGLGWNLHFGMRKDEYVYLGDGSCQKLACFYDSALADDPGSDESYHLTEGFLKVKDLEYITGQGWVPDTLWAKNGTCYIFDQSVGSSYSEDYKGRFVTKIEDTHENCISIEYYHGSPYIKRIIDTIGRMIEFMVTDSVDSTARLDKIIYKDSNGNPIEIDYVYDDETEDQYDWGNPLVKVIYPNDQFTEYEYSTDNNERELIKIIYPSGGEINYTYDTYWLNASNMPIGGDPNYPVRGLESREVDVDGDGTIEHTWSYEFDMDDDDIHTKGIVTDPQGNQTVYIHEPLYPSCDYSRYSLSGRIKAKRFYEGTEATGTLLREELTSWFYRYIGEEYYFQGHNVYTVLKRGEAIKKYNPNGSTHKDYVIEYLDYDNFGNCRKIKKWGEVNNAYLDDLDSDSFDELHFTNISGDEREIRREFWFYYFYFDSERPSDYAKYWDRYIIEPIRREEIYNENNVLVNLTTYWYDGWEDATLRGFFGDVTQVGRTIIEDNKTVHTNYEYDTYGNCTEVIDDNDHITRYFYKKPCAYLWKKKVDGTLVTTEYDHYFNTGLLKSITDANGNITEYEYDVLNRLTKVAKPDDDLTSPTIEYNYDDDLKRITVTQKKNGGSYLNPIYYFYDGLSRLVQTHQRNRDNTATVETNIEYDTVGRKYRESKPYEVSGAASQYNSNISWSHGYTKWDYDALERVISISYPPGNTENATVHYSYPSNVVVITDENDHQKTCYYDAYNNLIRIDEPLSGYRTHCRYNARNDLDTIITAKGQIITYNYNSLSDLTQRDHPDMGVSVYTYDGVGNDTMKINANGDTTKYYYDEINRRTAIDYKDSNFDVDYTYDEATSSNGKGNLTKVEDPSGTTVYHYDERNRLVKKVKTIDSVTYTTEYTYDSADNLTSIKAPVGSDRTHYEYDNVNRLWKVKRDISGTKKLLAEYLYYSTGVVREVKYYNPAGVNISKISYTYYPRDRMKSFTITNKDGKVLFKHEYEYDNKGNRKKLKETVNNEIRTFEYSYDGVDRLTHVMYDQGITEFQYDKVGNREYASYVGGKYGVWDYHYENNSDRLDYIELPPFGKIDHEYDNNGNQTKMIQTVGKDTVRVADFTYDYENRLTAVRYPFIPSSRNIKDADKVPDNLFDFVYDSNGMRVKKSNNRTTNNKSLITIYHYDEANQVLCETDSLGNVKATYIYANGQRICKIKTDGSIVYFHNDVLGSPVMLIDEEGNVVHLYHFGPFGNIEAAKGVEKNDYLYTGKERDETGLDYFGARYYEPTLGRFITPDPEPLVPGEVHLQEPQRLNSYVYCLNNPLRKIDPDGEAARLVSNAEQWQEYNRSISEQVDKKLGFLPGWSKEAIKSFLQVSPEEAVIGLGMTGMVRGKSVLQIAKIAKAKAPLFKAEAVVYKAKMISEEKAMLSKIRPAGESLPKITALSKRSRMYKAIVDLWANIFGITKEHQAMKETAETITRELLRETIRETPPPVY